jgi:hypothetical protein
MSREKGMIIIENSPPDVGFYSKSDIIMIFDNTGRMMSCTERISASIGVLEFFFAKFKSLLIKDRTGDDISTIVTRGVTFVDVTLIRESYKRILEKEKVAMGFVEQAIKILNELDADSTDIDFSIIEKKIYEELREHGVDFVEQAREILDELATKYPDDDTIDFSEIKKAIDEELRRHGSGDAPCEEKES